MKKILGAAIAASMLAAGSANAAIDNGFSQLTGNSEIVIALWDSVAKRSVLVDTGISYDSIVVDNANHSLNISSALTAAFGSNLSNVRWNVAGLGNEAFVNALGDDFTTDYTRNGAIFTGAPGVTYNPAIADVQAAYPTGFTELVARTGESINGDSLYGADAATLAAYQAARAENNFYVALTDTDVMYLDNALWGSSSRFAAWNTTRLGSGDLNAYWFHYNDAEGGTAARTDLGVFSLDLATGAFTYNSGVTSEVPVPAAAWLLISGLAGLGTVARRRKQA